jgi:hypothetical protein
LKILLKKHSKKIQNYVYQPPNSPDLNILDLSFFNSSQKRADRIKKQGHQNIIGLKESVERAYEEYPADTIAISYGHHMSML